MILTIEIIAIIAMCTLTAVAIWSFITLKQIFNQLKYKNYLLEKLNLHIYNLSKNIKLRKEDVVVENSSEISYHENISKSDDN
ncbi:hypothetical protein BD780_003194 [Clostridium tetanomorphum]|uniref:Uncharacterized protein n=1 Tax=Clostridium tetanomorphum TaxID=1553 RepID=A0A923ED88_CLOTT|nr:hypothetical protein [Clostridium tetanomorphum]KAJ52885.1 hypothetical protein CTM_05302 [Clostridium tetanomorphum DSM 665]MBC2399904.1 hypothetical protein [Clostridium tetanomorphum]MBP1865977.1 hypothetical protein [Clostridium tetanomorphum]NRS85969.1 hypothetical protein [Clostridium tetanomorphum]NRZ96021.1 hypothetical protein [Clostridium tetanomorphum]